MEKNAKPHGLAFVMHGLGGHKNQPHIQTFADAFRESGYTVVLFDATNSTGKSGGKLEDATLTNYYQDLADVIAWSGKQNWYREPFWLAGHSLGGISAALYAEKFPKKVKALAPISTVVSGKLSLETHSKAELREWERIGMRSWESSTQPGLTKHLKWRHITDRQRYDLLPKAKKLIMPVLLIVGSLDLTTPLKHQKMLFNALPGQKELRVINGARHTFTEKKHLAEIKKILKQWIKHTSD